MINNIHSVHALVRLLKSSTDPPSASGPSKIDIARLAWSDPGFRAANKGEVIGEWILTLLGQAKKQKTVDPTSDPIADSRYWTLLRDVLTNPPATARPTKTWLLPLLSRFQVDVIVIELLAFQSSQVLALARSVLTVLWPLAEKKISVDALGECLSVVLETCIRWERVDVNLAWICSAVVGAYRNALANAGNKKKFFTSFLSTHLSSWLSVVCVASSIVSPSPAKQLQDCVYAAGIDTIFSLDALKQPLDMLFDALSSSQSPTSSLLSLLPKLFASFLNATHRHRSALFIAAASATGGKEEVRKRGMEFVQRCWILTHGSIGLQEEFSVERWKSIIGVFEIVDDERLFIPCSLRGMPVDATCGGELALCQARDKAIEILENAGDISKDHRIEQAVVSMQLLGVLARIEYDFVGSILERVLSALINTPLTVSPLALTASSELLNQVLEYHTKTRTVHTYTLTLHAAVGAKPTAFASCTYSSFAFSLAHHLPILARALRTSLTPTQTIPLATAVLQAVERAWMAARDADQGEKVVTKQRIARDTDKSRLEVGVLTLQARAFSFTSRIAGTVLSNLPSIAYTEDAEESLKGLWEDAGKLGWTVIWYYLKGERQQVKSSHGKKQRHAVEIQPLSTHHPHIVTSATLRFLYDVRARVSFPLGNCDHLEEPDVETLLNVMQDEASDPELVLETIRTLFWYMWYTHSYEPEKRIEAQPIFTATLDVLTTRISLKSKWTGLLADLNRDNLGLAILYVLVDRWIDVLDMLASPESLEKLISLLCAVPVDEEDTLAERHLQKDHLVITLRVILLKLLQSAHFWELHNIRAVFLSLMLNLTAPLSSYCFPSTGVKSPSPTTGAQAELTYACNVYGLFGYVPSEYFTRAVRGELVKRAMAADVQICAMLAGVNEQSEATSTEMITDIELRMKFHAEESDDRIPAEDSRKWSRQLTVVRAFLYRMGRFLNAINYATSRAIVNHILGSPSISSPPEALTNVTLDLIQMHILSLLRSQETEAAASISRIISTLIATGPFSLPGSQETWMHTVVQPSVLKLIERLTSDFDSASLADEVKHSLKTLRDALESALSPHIQLLVKGDALALSPLPSRRIIAWSRVLSLTRWLGIHSQVVLVPFGQRLVASLICSVISAEQDPETCSNVLTLLFEELWCIPDISHRVHLDAVVGFYIVNGGHWDSNQVELTDTYITQASKKLSAEDFSHLLDTVAEGIWGDGLVVSHRERLIHLSRVILHDPPLGTLKVMQNFVNRCFSSFVDRYEICGGSSHLKIQCLEFAARHCSDRPVAIRPQDLGNILSFLDKILSCSSEHDSTTAFPIFHHIIAIVGALVRLRRDLVVHTLPHLSLILRQLMMLTRKIRPQLGAKQSKIVTDTFPSWLSASQPISTDEARSLARLLTSLTIKTVPRTHAYGHATTSTESQKAESLARPFAKHASYVLVAYVDAFNDPLCIINAEMRRELEPGLFALCEMVGEHSRDALMVSTLDSGGKMIMKSLWRDYEKQRYVGRG